MQNTKRLAPACTSPAFRFEALEPRWMLSSAYTITDLGPVKPDPKFGTFDGYSPPVTMAINNSGDVVGGGFSDAFVYRGGKTTLLSSLSPKLRRVFPTSINDAGAIGGTFPGSRSGRVPELGGDSFFGGGTNYIAFALPDAFVFQAGRFKDVGPGSVTKVSLSSNTAGLTLKPEAGVPAVQWSAHAAFFTLGNRRHEIKLPKHFPVTAIVAAAVDGAGDVILVGDHVYMLPSNSRNLVQIATPAFSAVTINDAGDVTGVVTSLDGDHAYKVSQGQTTDLGAIGLGSGADNAILGVNTTGEAVGWAFTASDGSFGGRHAVVSHNGVLTDMNTLAPPVETGWTLNIAEEVNDAGQIAAYGTDAAGTEHYLLLTPAGTGP